MRRERSGFSRPSRRRNVSRSSQLIRTRRIRVRRETASAALVNTSQTNMNKSILSGALALAAGSLFAADVVSTTTTTTSTGTIEEYTPGTTFVVKETAGPVKYRYG